MSSQVTIILERILSAGVSLGARDIHLTAGSRPLIRVGRGLAVLPEEEMITPAFLHEAIGSLLDAEAQRILSERLDVSAVITVAGIRYKVHAFHQKGGVALSVRPLAVRLKPLEQLNLPQTTLVQWMQRTQGLIIVCGPSGSGRSTVASSLLQSVNRERSARIITLEDPLEVLFTNQKSVIEQRAVGSDVASWQAGITSCLEEDADIIYLSDVPDRDTAQGIMRLIAAGHLVMCILNASDIVHALDVWMSLFDRYERRGVGHQLAVSLIGVIALRLVPKIGGGEVLAYEVLGASSALSNILRGDDWSQARTLFASGAERGMVSLDRSLADLVKRGAISREDALKEAVVPDDVERLLEQSY